jgi:hypothetical protein
MPQRGIACSLHRDGCRVFHPVEVNLQHPDPKKLRFPYETAVFSSSIPLASEE